MEKGSFYHPEIDGLRALAIIPVILFHAGIAGFGGGFVGVDIFFVISGYLITSIILRDIKQGSFSLVKFWERRVRRIVPALFFITSLVLAAGYFIVLYPVDYLDLGHSLIAQSLFLANIFFMRKSGYFAGPSESMPLLHTWSLSVEEQFYIGFPILIFLVWYFLKRSYSKAIVIVLVALALLSFFYNVYLTELYPGNAFVVPGVSYIWGSATNLNAGFFFLPARAWELLLGAFLATGIIAIRSKWIAELLTAVGVCGIVYAVTVFTETTVFPGYAALLPTLGAAFIIAGNMHIRTKVGEVLSFPLFVGIGLISYSLYLWHWPILVYSRTLLENTHLYMLPILLLIFALSWFSYQFVETPFRKKILCPKPIQMFVFGFCAIGLLVIAGLTIHHYRGFPDRVSEEARSIAEASVDGNPREFECFRKNYKEVFTLGDPCLLGAQDPARIDFVLWGDSHSDSAMPIIDLMAKEEGQTGAFFGAGGCRPMVWESVLSKDERCEQIKDQAIAYIKEHNVKKVLLISSWEGDPLKLNPTKGIGMNGSGVEVTSGNTEETFYDALKHTVELISNNNEVYVMKRIPVYENFDVRRLFTKAAFTHEKMEPITQTLQYYKSDNATENEAIDRLAQEGLLTVLDPQESFCSKDVCSVMIEDQILYKNGGHINTKGSMLLRPMFEDFFKN